MADLTTGLLRERVRRAKHLVSTCLLLAVAPFLLLAAVLEGRSALLHEHDHGPRHVHLVPHVLVESHSRAIGAWHAARHVETESGVERASVGDEVGVLIGLPATLIVASRSEFQSPRLSPPCFALLATPARHAGTCGEHDRHPPRARGEPPRAFRTGITAILSLSHALLI